MIKQLMYLSFSRSILTQSFLGSILEISRKNNALAGITGVLLYHNQIFFQVLEGGPDAVSECYTRITQDSRHGIISLINESTVDSRSFSSWCMEYAGPDKIGECKIRSSPYFEDFERHGEKVESNNSAGLILARRMRREFVALSLPYFRA